jgi:hemolysin D
MSSDAIQDDKKGGIYSSTVKFDRSTIQVKNKTVDLTPGMAVTVEIKTGGHFRWAHASLLATQP